MPFSDLPTPEPATRADRVGVIDVGSNSIRLVVFSHADRSLQPIFNEKVLCGLGRTVAETGRLDPKGVDLALDNLARFTSLAGVMRVARLEAFATAAVRDAEDGAAFIDRVRRVCGLDLKVLNGDEEARLTALGVVAAIPQADGLVGDLGGGSLELVTVADEQLGSHATLPLGPFRLADKGQPEAVADLIKQEFKTLPWLSEIRDRTFYPVGGAWRVFARIHMAQTAYPLQVIHYYTLQRREAEDLARIISRLGRGSLERLQGVPGRRLDALPYAGQLMYRLLRQARPRQVVFSAYGVREGLIFDRLTATQRARDPLVAACATLGRAATRFPVDGEALDSWIAPLFPLATAEDGRLRLAACWLGDIAGIEHPDYRAERAFHHALHLPVVGVDHPGRAFIALALLSRYGGDVTASLARSAKDLLPPERVQAARVTGLALRLAFTLSAGDAGLLGESGLDLEDEIVTLRLPTSGGRLDGEVLRRRFGALARALERTPVVIGD